MWFLSYILPYIQEPCIILSLNPTIKCKFSGTSCWKSKFQIICNSAAICAHFSKIYVWAYTMLICYFWISTVKVNENWVLFFWSSVKGSSWPLVPHKKCSWRKERKIGASSSRPTSLQDQHRIIVKRILRMLIDM